MFQNGLPTNKTVRENFTYNAGSQPRWAVFQAYSDRIVGGPSYYFGTPVYNHDPRLNYPEISASDTADRFFDYLMIPPGPANGTVDFLGTLTTAVGAAPYVGYTRAYRAGSETYNDWALSYGLNPLDPNFTPDGLDAFTAYAMGISPLVEVDGAAASAQEALANEGLLSAYAVEVTQPADGSSQRYYTFQYQRNPRATEAGFEVLYVTASDDTSDPDPLTWNWRVANTDPNFTTSGGSRALPGNQNNSLFWSGPESPTNRYPGLHIYAARVPGNDPLAPDPARLWQDDEAWVVEVRVSSPSADANPLNNITWLRLRVTDSSLVVDFDNFILPTSIPIP